MPEIGDNFADHETQQIDRLQLSGPVAERGRGGWDLSSAGLKDPDPEYDPLSLDQSVPAAANPSMYPPPVQQGGPGRLVRAAPSSPCDEL